jgi:NADH:ubiquinone oxidoreductase subunit H
VKNDNKMQIIAIYPLLEVLIVLVPILMSVAFVTVAERKIMAAMQRRVGPNAVGLWGLLQPFADALKLLVKEIVIPRQSNRLLFVIGPCITLIFALLGWAIIPFGEGLAIFDYELGVFFALAVSSLGSYGILISGWAANSKYSFMGAVRSTAQLLSYELVFSSIILILIIFSGSFSLTFIVECQQAVWNVFPLMPIALMFLIAILAETNRPPFDLPEAKFGL